MTSRSVENCRWNIRSLHNEALEFMTADLRRFNQKGVWLVNFLNQYTFFRTRKIFIYYSGVLQLEYFIAAPVWLQIFVLCFRATQQPIRRKQNSVTRLLNQPRVGALLQRHFKV